MMCAGKTL